MVKEQSRLSQVLSVILLAPDIDEPSITSENPFAENPGSANLEHKSRLMRIHEPTSGNQ